jgi:hypothetical protein
LPWLWWQLIRLFEVPIKKIVFDVAIRMGKSCVFRQISCLLLGTAQSCSRLRIMASGIVLCRDLMAPLADQTQVENVCGVRNQFMDYVWRRMCLTNSGSCLFSTATTPWREGKSYNVHWKID